MIREKLKVLRAEKGWTMRELGAKADIDPSLVSDYETGKAKPQLMSVVKLAWAFGLTIDTFTQEILAGVEGGIQDIEDLHFNPEFFDELVRQLPEINQRANASLTPILQYMLDQSKAKKELKDQILNDSKTGSGGNNSPASR
jgi:transcriptional regulator with XRE-family HTH domain